MKPFFRIEHSHPFPYDFIIIIIYEIVSPTYYGGALKNENLAEGGATDWLESFYLLL